MAAHLHWLHRTNGQRESGTPLRNKQVIISVVRHQLKSGQLIAAKTIKSKFVDIEWHVYKVALSQVKDHLKTSLALSLKSYLTRHFLAFTDEVSYKLFPLFKSSELSKLILQSFQ